MTEDEARARVLDLVGEDATQRLARLVDLVIDENQRQNLVARSTLAAIWRRHVLDSVQLLRYADAAEGSWLDVGTGGGFPGLAIAAASAGTMTLIEPRRKRAEFLRDAADRLGLHHVRVRQERVEGAAATPVNVISARAVASVAKLFDSALHCATQDTCWILPRGVGYAADLQEAKAMWQGVFHVEHSLSDPQAGIIVARSVTRR